MFKVNRFEKEDHMINASTDSKQQRDRTRIRRRKV